MHKFKEYIVMEYPLPQKIPLGPLSNLRLIEVEDTTIVISALYNNNIPYIFFYSLEEVIFFNQSLITLTEEIGDNISFLWVLYNETSINLSCSKKTI